MATIQRRPDPGTRARRRVTRGFDYLTLDPSPRLRRMRESQEERAKDPAEMIREAWSSVGAAIREASRIILARNSSLSR